MKFDLPINESPIIKVIGVGGGGSNAVTHMYKQGIVGVDFAICNTDNQAMDLSPVPTKIQLGPHLTEGRGAGSKPNVGKMACEESIEEVKKYLTNNCKMLFVTAGMGGGTGTGAAPIIAKAAKEMDILTVAIVTLPFTFEGKRRGTQAIDGLEELKSYVDTLIIISNDKLRQIFGNLSISDAFSQADDILTTAAKGIAEIITVPGYVNVDFEDVNTVMRESGVAIMGIATAAGEDRAKRAVDEALHSPLLEDNDISGARHILLNITSGTKEVTMDEVFEITEFVQEEAGNHTNLIWGNCYDESLGDKIAVTVIATGFDHGRQRRVDEEKEKLRVTLDDDYTPGRALANIGYETVRQPTEKTFEFDDIREKIDRLQHQDMGVDEVSEPSPAYSSEEFQRMEQRRRETLRSKSHRVKLNNPQTIIDLESEPAYLRRGVELDQVTRETAHGRAGHSTWTLSEEDSPELRQDNAYLHDNID